jgi:hypothetical protein
MHLLTQDEVQSLKRKVEAGNPAAPMDLTVKKARIMVDLTKD